MVGWILLALVIVAIVWVVGLYIRDMAAADRQAYDDYLKMLSQNAGTQSAPA